MNHHSLSAAEWASETVAGELDKQGGNTVRRQQPWQPRGICLALQSCAKKKKSTRGHRQAARDPAPSGKGTNFRLTVSIARKEIIRALQAR